MKLIKTDEATRLAFSKTEFNGGKINGDTIEYVCGEWIIYKSEVSYLDIKSINVLSLFCINSEVPSSIKKSVRLDCLDLSTAFETASE